MPRLICLHPYLFFVRVPVPSPVCSQGVASGDSGSSGLLQTVEVQRGQRVQALQFNSLRPSLLAAGTSSGGLSIVDVEIATEAVAHKPGADGAGKRNSTGVI